MAKNKTPGKKSRLGKIAKQTRWAPFWLIPKIFGLGKKVHPSAITSVKRRWRRGKTQA